MWTKLTGLGQDTVVGFHDDGDDCISYKGHVRNSGVIMNYESEKLERCGYIYFGYRLYLSKLK